MSANDIKITFTGISMWEPQKDFEAKKQLEANGIKPPLCCIDYTITYPLEGDVTGEKTHKLFLDKANDVKKHSRFVLFDYGSKETYETIKIQEPIRTLELKNKIRSTEKSYIDPSTFFKPKIKTSHVKTPIPADLKDDGNLEYIRKLIARCDAFIRNKGGLGLSKRQSLKRTHSSSDLSSYVTEPTDQAAKKPSSKMKRQPSSLDLSSLMEETLETDEKDGNNIPSNSTAATAGVIGANAATISSKVQTLAGSAKEKVGSTVSWVKNHASSLFGTISGSVKKVFTKVWDFGVSAKNWVLKVTYHKVFG